MLQRIENNCHSSEAEAFDGRTQCHSFELNMNHRTAIEKVLSSHYTYLE